VAAERKDVWASGDAYEPYVGRWSQLVAREFVSWLGAPPKSDWLDVGCGTAALCEVILQIASPRRVTGIDASDGFVEFARHKVPNQRATFQVGEAQALPFPDGSFDATVAGLVINFVSDQAKAVAEMRRVTRPSGIVAGYVWDYAGEMQMMRRFWDAAIALDQGAVPFDEDFPSATRSGWLRFFVTSGLIACRPVLLTFRRSSRILTTTGTHSWVVKLRRLGIACLFLKSVAPSCAIASGKIYRQVLMVPSI
jgi:SAM-dependent methyltransferase